MLPTYVSEWLTVGRKLKIIWNQLERYHGRGSLSCFWKNISPEIELKFLELKQENMIVAEYEAKFTDLSRFVLEFMNTEANWARIFQLWLKQWIQNNVDVLELTNYATLVKKLTIVEVGSDQNQSNKEIKKRKFEKRGGRSASGSFPRKFVRGTVSQPAKSTWFMRTESGSVAYNGREAGVSHFSQPRPHCRTARTLRRSILGHASRG